MHEALHYKEKCYSCEIAQLLPIAILYLFICLKMKDVSDYLLLNASEDDSSFRREFPYWRPTLAIDLLLFVSFTFCSIFIFNLPLLVALFRINKRYLNSINALHISLLTATIVEDALLLVIRFFYMPGIYRFCYCSEVGSTLIVAVTSFFVIHRSSTFISLAILQCFVVIVRKKNFAYNLKVSFGMILLSIGLGLVYVAAIIEEVRRTRERALCFESRCLGHQPEVGTSNLVKILLSSKVVAYLPTIVVVVVTSTWSCAIFKKYYTGGDDQLNRKMLSLPFIMPLATMASTLLEVFILIVITEIILKSNISSSIYSAYWIRFAQTCVFLVLRICNRLIYPLVLVYTHTELRHSIGALLKQFKRGNNRVTPEQVD